MNSWLVNEKERQSSRVDNDTNEAKDVQKRVVATIKRREKKEGRGGRRDGREGAKNKARARWE